MALTDTQIRKLKPGPSEPYEVADGGGLFLEVRPTGTKSWRMRYRWGGRQPKVSFGQYPAISLAEARRQREEVKTALERDQDPRELLRAKKRKASPEERAQNSFEGFAMTWYREQVEGKVSTDRNTLRALQKDAFPILGRLDLSDVSPEDVLAVTDRVKKRGADQMALVTRNVIKRVYDYAIARGRARTNPAAAIRGKFIATPRKRERVLRPEEIGDVLRALDRSSCRRSHKLAIYLLLVTLVRRTELVEVQWCEIDFEKGEWVIPASRMKMRKEHVVYLPDQAVEALRELHELANGSEFVFPSSRGRHDRPIHPTTLNLLVRGLNAGVDHFVPHDFRRTGSTLLHEMGHRPDIIEKLLAHENGGVKGVYNRAEYAKQRRELLQEWADFVDAQRQTGRKVVLGSFGQR